MAGLAGRAYVGRYSFHQGDASMRPAFRILGPLVAGVALMAAALPPSARAAEATPVKAAAAKVQATGTITAIDMASRHVTIRDASSGEEETFAVGKSVRLERAKVGDEVQLDYSVAVAVSLKKGGGAAREKIEAASSARNPSSVAPGMQAMSRTTVVADVLDVNQATQVLRLKGPEGHVVDVKVRDKQALADVKVGDQVVAEITEAVALTLKQAPAGAASAAH
jgi:hypothetical protein